MKSKKLLLDDVKDMKKMDHSETIVYYESGKTFNKEINNLSCEHGIDPMKAILPWNSKETEDVRYMFTLGTKSSQALWHDSRLELTDKRLIVYNTEAIGTLSLDDEMCAENIK